jgi:hypothetical protein
MKEATAGVAALRERMTWEDHEPKRQVTGVVARKVPELTDHIIKSPPLMSRDAPVM